MRAETSLDQRDFCKRKQTIDSLRVKLAWSSKENATNVKNRIENEHKTKKIDFDHNNNLLKFEVKMLKESVIEKKAMITQLNEKVW